MAKDANRMPALQDFNTPRQKPWVLIVVVLAVLGVVVYLVARHVSGCRAERAAAARPYEIQVEVPPAAAVPSAPAPASPAAPSATPPAVSPPAPASAGTPVDPAALETARREEAAGHLVEAREQYLAILAAQPAAAILTNVEARLNAISPVLALTPHAMPEKTSYVIARGDSVERIANKFGTTKELVVRANEIRNVNLIRPGDPLGVVTGRFAVAVSKSRRDLVVTLNGRFFKRYRVGTGKFGKTPVGTFVVFDRIAQPTWWRPDGRAIPYGDKENILGTHWLAIRPTGTTPPVQGYGIHGTWDDSSIGLEESAGCIRLRNPDIEELFALLPVGTPVTISE